jgi:hypothetical protein
MPTLSQVTSQTRTILKWGGLFLGILLLFFIGLGIYQRLFAPEAPPTVAFGKISFQFPQSSPSDSFEYSLDTITGNLPTLPTQAKVHRIEQKQADLLSLPRAIEKVEALGFRGDPIKLSESIYQWEDKTPPVRTLTMNIFTNNFNLISSYLADSTSLTFNSTNVNSAITQAKSFLETLNLLPQDLDSAKTKTSLFTIDNFALAPATSISNAKVIQVSFYQNNVNDLPIFYSNPELSPINLLVAEIDNKPMVVEANFTYQRIHEENSTYPIKTAEQALSDLKKGNAFISLPGANKSAVIKKVTLGYFLGDKTQSFLVPVIVFEGNNFQALVLAITDEWVNK